MAIVGNSYSEMQYVPPERWQRSVPSWTVIQDI